MPHYRDGSEARVGDIVKGKDYRSEVVGVVASITPGSDTCNMTVLRFCEIHTANDGSRVVVPRSSDHMTATCREFEKIA